LERQQAFRAMRERRQGALPHLLDGALNHANWRVKAGCVAVLAAA
jgi:hypothetical protein